MQLLWNVCHQTGLMNKRSQLGTVKEELIHSAVGIFFVP
jgi:hypothetical protein